MPKSGRREIYEAEIQTLTVPENACMQYIIRIPILHLSDIMEKLQTESHRYGEKRNCALG